MKKSELKEIISECMYEMMDEENYYQEGVFDKFFEALSKTANKASKTDTYKKFSKEATKFGNKVGDKTDNMIEALNKKGINIGIKKADKKDASKIVDSYNDMLDIFNDFMSGDLKASGIKGRLEKHFKKFPFGKIG